MFVTGSITAVREAVCLNEYQNIHMNTTLKTIDFSAKHIIVSFLRMLVLSIKHLNKKHVFNKM